MRSRKICFDRDWPYEACLRQGLLSLSEAAQSQAWHGCYGNDLVQRGQAGQPVVLSFSRVWSPL